MLGLRDRSGQQPIDVYDRTTDNEPIDVDGQTANNELINVDGRTAANELKADLRSGQACGSTP